MKIVFNYSLLLLFLISCKKENAFDCVKSNGEMVTVDRAVDSFATVIVEDKIDLNIVKGAAYKMEINAGENLISNISTVNRDGSLRIQNKNKCNFVRGYKKKITVTLTVPYVYKVINEGVGTISIENFSQDTLLLRAENSGDIHVSGQFNQLRTSSHGNGDIYLKGSSNSLYVYMFGTNFLRAENLSVSSYIFVETVSIGDCIIRAPDNGVFEYNLWRSGNIYYSGNPSAINDFSDGTAQGKLIKR